jgi:hypothetical protein
VLVQLIAAKVDNPLDFEWQGQMRYYWEDDKCVVRMVQASFDYGYEYPFLFYFFFFSFFFSILLSFSLFFLVFPLLFLWGGEEASTIISDVYLQSHNN